MLADQNMTKIARDKNAHKDCPEWIQVQKELAEHERKALNKFHEDYLLKVKHSEHARDGEVFVVEQRFQVSLYGSVHRFLSNNANQDQIKNIQDEMFHATRGKYMELVMGRRAAEDDEHTEVSFLFDIRNELQLIQSYRRMGLSLVPRSQNTCTASGRRGPERWSVGSTQTLCVTLMELLHSNEAARHGTTLSRKFAWEKT